MRRYFDAASVTWLALVVVAPTLGLSGCVDAPTAPEPAPPITGNYTLVLQASTICTALPVAQFQWDVEARTVGEGLGAETRVTLPTGNDDVDVVLIYSVDPTLDEELPPVNFVTGQLQARRAPVGANLFVTIDSSAQATVTSGGGRGQVQGGTFNGRIGLTDRPEGQDPNEDALGSCTAADHHWTLATR